MTNGFFETKTNPSIDDLQFINGPYLQKIRQRKVVEDVDFTMNIRSHYKMFQIFYS